MFIKRSWGTRAITVLGLLVAVLLLSTAPAGADKTSTSDIVLNLPLIFGVDCYPPLPIPPDDIDKDLAVEAKINEIRDQNKLASLTKLQKLTQAALRHSNDMADNNFFDHTGSDGTTAGDRLDQACYIWQAYGEIIAAGYTTPTSVVEAWMSGSGHREIILDPAYEDFAAGYAYNRASDYTHYWTVVFGLLPGGSTTTTGDRHVCSYNLEEPGASMQVRLYTNQPCKLYGELQTDDAFQD